RIVDDGPEAHLAQDVPFDVDSRRDLDKFHTRGGSPKDTPLSHVEDGLTGLGSVGAAEGGLLHLVDELRRSPFTCDMHLPVCKFDVQPTGRKRTREQKLLCVLRDVDEAAGPCEPAPEPTDIDISICVDLGHAKTCQIEPAAVIKIELLVLLDDS